MVKSYNVLFVLATLGLLIVAMAACEEVEEGGLNPEMASSLKEDTAAPWVVELPWEQAEPKAPLKVLSSSTFKTGSGENVYLVGEIENAGEQNIQNVTIEVNAYSDAGQVLDRRTMEGFLKIVPAGGKVSFGKAMDARDVIRYELTVKGEPTDAQPRGGLEIVSRDMTEPKEGYVWISGEVKNTADVGAASIEVIAVLHDDQGEVMDATVGTIKETIPPGGTAPFKFMATHRGATSYELYVQGQDAE